jgi:hypothetical protein
MNGEVCSPPSASSRPQVVVLEIVSSVLSISSTFSSCAVELLQVLRPVADSKHNLYVKVYFQEKSCLGIPCEVSPGEALTGVACVCYNVTT